MFQCDDTRGCVMQLWPPGDEHMCSKHVEAWNKLIVKQKFCTSSLLITEINILRCTVSKTSKFVASSWHSTLFHEEDARSAKRQKTVYVEVIMNLSECRKVEGSLCKAGKRCTWTLILLTWRIWWAPNNASRWQMGFNWAFKWLNLANEWSWETNRVSRRSSLHGTTYRIAIFRSSKRKC